jgi:hypothetical protein
MEMVVFNKKPTDVNPSRVVIAAIGHDGWGTVMRVFAHKGIDTTPLARRPMVEKEIEVYKKAWRTWHMPYKKWENLIADEWDVTGDVSWCRELIKHAGAINIDKLPKELFT